MPSLAKRIDNALPQTQCTRCGYADCAAYAHAIGDGEAGIHQCPPGGAEGIERLAGITGRPVMPLGAEFGTEGPRAMAVIDEHWCIGCTLCLEACPTDAIMGINKHMHTVVEAHCTGCELCIPVCPVDCISMEVATPGLSGWQAWSAEQAVEARARYALHKARFGAKEATETASALGPQTPSPLPAADDATARKRAVIEATLARVRFRLPASGTKF